MIADLLDSGLYEIENKTPANEDNPLEKLRLRYLPVASECPKCKSSNFIKKTASTRTIIDVLGNQPIEITVVKQRYKCSCGKTFTLKDDTDYPDRMHITKETSDKLGTMILGDADLSITQAGEMFGVGRTTASKALHQKIKELADQTFSVAPCVKISYIPFYFTNKERCAIAGIDRFGTAFLLDIIDEYSEERLSRFFPKTDSFKNDISVSFCKLDSTVTQAIRTHNSADVGIVHRCVSDYIEKAREKVGDALYAEKYDVLADLERVMFSQPSVQFGLIFSDWKAALSSEVRDALSSFIETVNTFFQECTVTTMHPKKDTSFKKLREIITKFRKDRTNFDTMVFRLLYANKTAMSTPNGPHIWNSINSMMAPVTGGMSEFGVDIDALYEEILKS
ncbi:MAG: transposase family protein [Ruminococcaceae bacterium]|nr:transposase family protein [Oscillospiraceae bacterium]